MFSILLPLFFFSTLMGGPVVGFLVFVLLGLWQSFKTLRLVKDEETMVWTKEDRLISLCFMSIPLFKLLSVLWSSDLKLALANVGWHLYLLFWPLVLAGLAKCSTPLTVLDKAVAAGIIIYSLMATAVITVLNHNSTDVLGGRGLTAQLLMVLGSWNLLALTRPDSKRWLFGAAFIATWLALLLTLRRQELLGFTALSMAIVIYRGRDYISALRLGFLLTILVGIVALVIAYRWQSFTNGIQEIQEYFTARSLGTPYADSSWGARLEMWRLGWYGFLEHPLLGLGASARPYTMPDAPAIELFGHRHFHSQLIQTLVEGGLVGLVLAFMALGYSSLLLIVRAHSRHPEYALMAAAMLGAYFIEGLASAALQYDKPNAFLVVSSAWLWVQVRPTPPSVMTRS